MHVFSTLMRNRPDHPPFSPIRFRLHAQTAFLSALRSSVIMFLISSVTSLIGLVRCLFFKQKVDWKLGLLVLIVLTTLLFLGLFVTELADLRAEDLRRNAQEPVFSGRSWIRGVYGSVIILCGFFVQGFYREHLSIWMQLIPLVFTTLVWYCWPRAIHFSAQALEQRTLFGIPRRLEFQKIEYASYSHSDARTVVSGKGVEIVHTGEHADKSRFHDLITERTGKSVFGV
jgi:hypothetical protein